MVKVISSKFRYRWKGLVIRITHAKYERLISKGKKVMANVKVFWRTDGQKEYPISYDKKVMANVKVLEK